MQVNGRNGSFRLSGRRGGLRRNGWGLLAWALGLFPAVGRGDGDAPVEFQVRSRAVLQSLQPEFCWFHPRAVAIPSRDPRTPPAVLITLQKHLAASDHYSGMYFLRSDDLGASWSGPAEIPSLGWTAESPGITRAVCDVTPGWHPPTGKVLLIGVKVRYSDSGDQLTETPRAHECAYAWYDPDRREWSAWKMLAMPDTSGTFFLVAPGCTQWLVRDDGKLLIPVYRRGPSGSDYSSTVLLCRFDGETLSFEKHGTVLAREGGRGYVEPSLAKFRGRYFLTLRNDEKAYVSTSGNGLNFDPPRPWTFDDGAELGSYNTQQHWLVHSGGLFLAYTRRGADNDRIFRHRAPIFLARIDPEKLVVIRSTEQVAIPERGVPLGNFGAADITPGESWITDAEYLLADKPHPRGGDGSLFVARIRWSAPNRRVVTADRVLKIVTLGDSITKGVRPGVTADQTMAAALQRQLRQKNVNAEVVNVGIGGERTDQALTRLARDVLALEPDVVTIMYGANDSYVDKGKTEPRLAREAFEENLRRIVAELRRSDVRPVLMTSPYQGRRTGSNGLGEHPNVKLAAYMEHCRAVAKEGEVPLVDHYETWRKLAGSGVEIDELTTDGLHPNAAGAERLADRIVPVLEEQVLGNWWGRNPRSAER
jgi:lysophospholipase L1-like esterase